LSAGGVQQGDRQVFLRRMREHGKMSHWNDLHKENRNNVWIRYLNPQPSPVKACFLRYSAGRVRLNPVDFILEDESDDSSDK
jgi:hypothetical protein